MELQKPNYDMLIVTLYILGFININRHDKIWKSPQADTERIITEIAHYMMPCV